jgi:hypothetical protein
VGLLRALGIDDWDLLAGGLCAQALAWVFPVDLFSEMGVNVLIRLNH